MKYQFGQTVTLLNTEYKPAGNAIVCNFEESSNKYEVDFTYPDSDMPNKISVPAERLVLLQDNVDGNEGLIGT